MKLRNYKFVFLFLAFACKDGGTLPETDKNTAFLFAFNNAVANQFTKGNTSTAFSYSSAGFQFTVSKPFSNSCSAPIADVKINNVPVSFESVSCFTVQVKQIGDNDPVIIGGEDFYYIILATKRVGDILYDLFYGFPGAKPGNKTYGVSQLSGTVGYSIYKVGENGEFTQIESYRPMNGIATTVTSLDKVEMNSLMDFREYNSGKFLTISSKLSCCSD
jgi:hypothetical protein